MDNDLKNGSNAVEFQANAREPVSVEQALAEGAAFLAGDAAAAQPDETKQPGQASSAPPTSEPLPEPSEAGDPVSAPAETGKSDPAPLVAARSMMGDLRDCVLELVRDLREPFHKLSENQQRFYAERVQERCAGIVTAAINALAARDFTAIPVLLEQVAFKPKGIETKMSLAALSKEVRHALVDAQNQPVMIVVADPKAFLGARGPAKIDRQALFDAPPRDPEGEAIGPLFTGTPDAGEGGDLGEPGTDTAAPVDDGPEVVSVEQLAEERRQLRTVAFEEGKADAAAGHPIVANNYTHDDTRACWEAGWLLVQIEGLADERRQQVKQRKSAEKHFRDMGRDAAANGGTAGDNPLAGIPIDWPAEQWAAGFEGVSSAKAQLAASDAAAAERAAVAAS